MFARDELCLHRRGEPCDNWDTCGNIDRLPLEGLLMFMLFIPAKLRDPRLISLSHWSYASCTSESQERRQHIPAAGANRRRG
eukprot:3254210-Pyramimonas_sp.AAC.1